MKFLLQIFFLLLCIKFYSQDKILTNQDVVNKTEEFILYENKDSANFYIKKLTKSDYSNILTKVNNRDKVSYEEYNQFFSSLSNRQSVKYIDISSYIDKFISIPKDKNFNDFYYKIKWDQIYKLRDEVGIQEASEKQIELEKYVSGFNDSDIKVQKAKLKLTTHPIVIHQIENNIRDGKKLVLESLEKAKKLNNLTLQIAFLYHLSDFLILEGKLQEYINVCEESILLESQLPENSPYYFATTQHLIDAYIYKGGHNERVNLLINEMYNNKSTKTQTYSLYLKLLAYSDSKS